MQTFTKALLGSTLGVVFAGMASAQDDCSTAVVIAGEGSFPYDRTLATSSGFDGGDGVTTCLGAVNDGAGNLDTFFAWTPAASGNYTMDVSLEGVDLETNVHLGGDCTATCLIESDPQTFTFAGAVSGTTYLVQIGNWSATSTAAGAGALGITLNPPPPANDDCSTAIPASVGVNPFDTTGATESGFLGAGSGAAPTLGADAFYTFTVPSAGSWVFDTCSGATAFDTELVIYSGSDCLATFLAQNDDDNTLCTANQSRIQLNGLLGGEMLLIQVAHFATGNPGGVGDLNISMGTPPPPPPSNDTCATPDVIAGVGSFAYDRTFALSSGFDGNDGVTTCLGAVNGGSGNRDVFFAWTPAVSGDYIIDNSSEGNDTNIDVSLGADCAATCLVDSDPSTFTFTGAVSGTTYLIQIGNWSATSTAAGAGTLDISLAPPPPPVPANDTCATPDVIAGEGSFPYDRIGALSSGFDGGDGVTTCLGAINDGAGNNDVFFAWTPAATGDYTISTASEGNDTEVNIHLGADCTATCLVESDPETFTFAGAVSGTTYLVQVGNWSATSTAAGPGTLDITLNPPPPANDDCSTPDAISAEGAYAFNNAFATTSGFDGGDSVNCMSPANTQNSEFGASADDLFWAFTVPCDGDYSFDTSASPVLEDTRLSVHLGADCTATCITSNDDIDLAGGDFLSQVDLVGLVSGDTYLIQVGMWNETQIVGDGVLTITNTSGPCPTNGIVEFACSPASMHLGGGAATMALSTFSPGSTPSGLNLQVTDGSAGEFGFLLVSTDHTASLAIFNGVLCLDSPFGRYNPQIATNQGFPQLNSIGQFDGAGVLQSLFGNATSTGGAGYDVPLELPFSPVGQVIAPGDTYAFQCWFRDGASANFSDSVKVLF